jgi:tetraacyldisaccharide 4'-kinase
MPESDLLIEWPAGGPRGERVLRTMVDGVAAPWSLLLAPLEGAYAGVMATRNAAYDRGILRAHRVAVPVISVGNIVAGGTGKTPVTRWLTEQLLARGRRPAILHGGYGMDEPRLHHQWHPDLPVIANRDRVAGARRAIEQGADVIVLDDGFQHRRLARDLDIVLLAAETTNTRRLPRGPAREPLRALVRSDFVLITRKTAGTDDAVLLETRMHQEIPGVPTARVHLRLQAALPAEAVVAVAAIARPDLFLRQLIGAGARAELLLAFPDHHEYTKDDAACIVQRAASRVVVTTAKDAVKLRALLPEQPMLIAEQTVVFENGMGELLTTIDNIL